MSQKAHVILKKIYKTLPDVYYSCLFLSTYLNGFYMCQIGCLDMHYSLHTLAIAQTSCASWLNPSLPLHKKFCTLLSLVMMGVFQYLAWHALSSRFTLPNGPKTYNWDILVAMCVQIPNLFFSLSILSDHYFQKKKYLKNLFFRFSFNFFSLQPFFFLVPLAIKIFYRRTPQTYLFQTVVFIFIYIVKTLLERKNVQYALEQNNQFYISSLILISLHLASLLHISTRVQTFCLIFQTIIHATALIKNILILKQCVAHSCSKPPAIAQTPAETNEVLC